MNEEIKIYACTECGQVYYNYPPKKCINRTILNKECGNTKFERIKQEDVIRKKDIWKFILNELKMREINGR